MYLPKISIIVPSFNQGHFIEETILSVIGQSYKNFELIVIDGGSMDNTIEIIKKYSSRIQYWVSEKDNGQSEAINKGLKIATGDIVTWLNSDDTYEPATLETVAVEFSDHPGISILHGKAKLFGEKTTEQIIGLKENIPLHEYFAFMRFPQPSSFYRKETVERTGGVNDLLHYSMDFEMLVKSLLMGAGIRRTDALLSSYRIHKNSKSNQELLFLKEWSLVASRFFQSFEQGKQYSGELSQLGLCGTVHKGYDTVIDLSAGQLKDVFLLHLDMCYHFSYRNYDYGQAKRIGRYLEKNYPVWFVQKAYRKYNHRMQLIPKFVFKFIRRSAG